MCLPLLIFTQLFFESRTVGASQTGAKTEFIKIAIQAFFQGYAFWDPEKLTTDCLSLCNNAGLISKVSKK